MQIALINKKGSGIAPDGNQQDENTQPINGGFNPDDFLEIPPAGVHPKVMDALNGDRSGPD